MRQQFNQLAVDELESASLLDCYRIALDFGMPAAIKAYDKLALESMQQLTEPNIKNDK